jgi:hypothetical protein
MGPKTPRSTVLSEAEEAIIVAFRKHTLLPLEGWRHVAVTERRTAIDYAKILRDLADIHFPKAETIVLVQDNLTRTRRPPSMKRSSRPRPAGSSSGLSGTTQLAQYGRVRARRSRRPVPQPPRPRHRNAGKSRRRMAQPPKHPQRQGQLALHNRGRASKT